MSAKFFCFGQYIFCGKKYINAKIVFWDKKVTKDIFVQQCKEVCPQIRFCQIIGYDC